ncbi:cytochrome P450 76C1-like protein [Tanacetum coccineum]
MNIKDFEQLKSAKSGEGNDSNYTGDVFRGIVFKIIELLEAPNIADFIPVLSWLDLQGKQRQMQRQRENLDRIFNNIIERRIESNSIIVEECGSKDLIQMLSDHEGQKDGPRALNKDHIKALLMDEPGEVIGVHMVEETHLPKLTYLDVMIKETFRVHPPLPLLIQRCPNICCMVGGYTILNGTIVYINIWAIHHDPQKWMDPLEFKPERSLKNKWDYNGNNLKFLPFGLG